MQSSIQPHKHDAEELTFLYDFVSECPNPQISASLKKVVSKWLNQPSKAPQLSLAIRNKLGLTDAQLLEVAWLLAINPHTPPSVLQDLCTEGSPELLERIAENRHSWPSTLACLSYQALAEIRIAAAGNPNTPLASIMIMVRDENPDVRFSMAEDANLPEDALNILAADDNPFVKLRAENTLQRIDIEKKLKLVESENTLQ